MRLQTFFPSLRHNRKKKNVPKFYIHGFAENPEHQFWQDAALAHFRRFSQIPNHTVATMGYRRFDTYVLRAIAVVFMSYTLNLALRRAGPYFNFRVNDIEVGKYITSSIQRAFPKTITHKISFFLHFHIGLLRASFVLGAAMREKDTASAVCLGDVWYLDGIWLDYFLPRDGVLVYVNIDPFGLVCVSKNFSNLSSLRISLEDNLRASPLNSKNEVVRYMNARLADPDTAMHYYKSGHITPGKHTYEEGEVTAVVYCHSFTDAQMNFGYDGFRNVYDWLFFTTTRLLRLRPELNIVVKAHPVFFANWNPGKAALQDRQIWESLSGGLGQRVKVEGSSVSNRDFLKQFDRHRTVLVSHHGNALPEGAFLGFPVVGSAVAPWGRDYTFCTTWSNRDEYAELLGRLPELAGKGVGLTRSLQEYISYFYMNEPIVASSTHEIQRIRHRFLKDKSPATGLPADPPTREEFPDDVYEAMKDDYSHRIRVV